MNVLLVDDNAGDARLVQELLRDDDYGRVVEVTACNSLDEALSLLEAQQFDAVLLDLGLPGSGGLDTLDTVLGTGLHRPAIVVTTGSDDGALTRKALRRGAQDYLVKGKFDGEQVARSLRYAVERKRFERELAEKAFVDPLTGLPNRTFLVESLSAALSEAARMNHRVGVLFIDMDGFKAVNDILGHSEGDWLLRLVSDELRAQILGNEVLARFGGDEFIVMLPRVRQLEDVNSAAERLLSVFRKPRWLAGREFMVTASIGVALFPEHGRDADALLASADAAMYRAKEAGKDTHRLFGHHIRETLQERLEVESELRRALQMREFTLYYQPLVATDSGRPTGMEALLRWRHPTRGVIEPAEFLPLVEETGLMLPISEWVLREACSQARAWQEAGVAGLPVSVNLSPSQFGQPELTNLIQSVLTETGLPGEGLRLEITETVAMRDIDYAVSVLSELRETGVRASIDDFGTGYSSLSYLGRLPIDCIKIDKSFVGDIPESPTACEIANAIVALAHALRLSVLAEGVETRAQLDFLRKCRCDEAQGYLFSRPLSADQMWDYLLGKSSPGLAETA